LALKENIEALKSELSAQEELLKNIIQGERFFKRHKRSIIAATVVAVILLIGYSVNSAVNESNLKASNEAYKTLIVFPTNEQALNTLKNKNKPLYRAFVFQEAAKNGDNASLQALINEDSTDVIGQIAAYILGQNSEVMSDFAILQSGYELLKAGKANEANLKFTTITSSSLSELARGLEHYQPNKQEE
jgi:predicted negative regulator of RcsB-dependent stress response